MSNLIVKPEIRHRYYKVRTGIVLTSETTLSSLLNAFVWPFSKHIFLKPEEEELGVGAPLKADLKFLILGRDGHLVG